MNVYRRVSGASLSLLLLVASGAAALSDERERRATLDGRSVLFSDSAPGMEAETVPLVLVHGWASDRRVWSALIDELTREEDRRVLAVDLPGHGASEEPATRYDMGLFARALVATMDEADLPEAILVGHSNGTPVIREVYRQHPDRVAALVILDGPLRSFVSAEMAASVRESLSGEDWQQTVGGFVDGMPAPDLTSEQRAFIRMMALEQSQEAVLGGFEAALAPEIWRDDAIEVPVLMILAEQPSWSAEYLTWVEERVPELELHVWSGAGHFLMVERPGQVAELVQAFADRIAAGGERRSD